MVAEDALLETKVEIKAEHPTQGPFWVVLTAGAETYRAGPFYKVEDAHKRATRVQDQIKISAKRR